MADDEEEQAPWEDTLDAHHAGNAGEDWYEDVQEDQEANAERVRRLAEAQFREYSELRDQGQVARRAIDDLDEARSLIIEAASHILALLWTIEKDRVREESVDRFLSALEFILLILEDLHDQMEPRGRVLGEDMGDE